MPWAVTVAPRGNGLPMSTDGLALRRVSERGRPSGAGGRRNGVGAGAGSGRRGTCAGGVRGCSGGSCSGCGARRCPIRTTSGDPSGSSASTEGESGLGRLRSQFQKPRWREGTWSASACCCWCSEGCPSAIGLTGLSTLRSRDSCGYIKLATDTIDCATRLPASVRTVHLSGPGHGRRSAHQPCP